MHAIATSIKARGLQTTAIHFDEPMYEKSSSRTSDRNTQSNLSSIDQLHPGTKVPSHAALWPIRLVTYESDTLSPSLFEIADHKLLASFASNNEILVFAK
jgi:hypothetical protein